MFKGKEHTFSYIPLWPEFWFLIYSIQSLINEGNFNEAKANTVYIKTDLGEIGSKGVKWTPFV